MRRGPVSSSRRSGCASAQVSAWLHSTGCGVGPSGLCAEWLWGAQSCVHDRARAAPATERWCPCSGSARCMRVPGPQQLSSIMGRLKTTEMSCLWILEARSSESGCCRAELSGSPVSELSRLLAVANKPGAPWLTVPLPSLPPSPKAHLLVTGHQPYQTGPYSGTTSPEPGTSVRTPFPPQAMFEGPGG